MLASLAASQPETQRRSVQRLAAETDVLPAFRLSTTTTLLAIFQDKDKPIVKTRLSQESVVTIISRRGFVP